MGVINGFLAVLDYIKSAWDYLSGVVSDSWRILSSLPRFFSNAQSIISSFPTFLVSISTFCLTVRVLMMIIHCKAGDD